jgi:glucose/mannose transport system permease protein
MPLIVMVVTAIRPDAEILAHGMLARPLHPTLEGLEQAWKALSGSFFQSVLITVIAVSSSVGLGAVIGGAIAARASWVARMMTGTLVIALFIPPQVILYPMIIFTRILGLFGSKPGLILAHTIWGIPLTSLLFRNYFSSLPVSIVNAARIDGASFFYYFMRVAIPTAAPIAVVAIILQFTYVWNDMLLGVTFGGHNVQPVTVALAAFGGGQFGPQHPGLSMAAVLVASLPTLALYALSARLLSSYVPGEFRS